MSKKKNIDQLFQENFENFEASPAIETWKNIEAKLEKKKKRRIIPFWWKFSGVAAGLLIGLCITYSIYDTAPKPENTVVFDNHFNKAVDKSDHTNSGKGEKSIINENNTSSDVVISNETISKNNNIINNGDKLTTTLHPKENTITENKLYSNKNNAAFNKTILKKKTQQIVVNTSNKDTHNNKVIASNNKQDASPSTSNTSINTIINFDGLDSSTYSNSKIVTTETKVNDTTKIIGATTNALEELLNEKESKTKQQSKENRWQIASNVAPVFLGSVTNGSPVDPMFEDNSKTYNTSFSIGVGISYALNDKFSVRTGINKMSVDYDTNGIVFFADIQDAEMTNVNPSSTGKNIHVENANSENGNLLPFENSFVHKNEGYINQKLGYYEVPVEITYAFINKRFGVKVIGGVSTFFLNENSISAISENISTNIGKANNLNDVHFSTNVGLGLKYGFLKSFEFSVEPTIKYQLNTFSSNAGNFKPYVFGVYSGISYKF